METNTVIRKLLISKREAAALSVSLRTLENLIRRKELPVRKLGRRTLIPLNALEQFAKRDHFTQGEAIT